MQSDFLELRGAILVPPFPRERVLSADMALHSKPRRRIVVAIPLLAACVLAAAAAAVVSTTHIRLTRGGGLVLSSPHSRTINHPSSRDLARAVHEEDFRVVLPRALPQGAVLGQLVTAGKNALVLRYDMPVTRQFLYFFLVNDAAVDIKQPKHALGSFIVPKARISRMSMWHVDGEGVIAVASRSADAQARLRSIRNAMMAAGGSP